MKPKIAAGTALTASTPIINAAANAVGVAGTGTAIGTLHGAAHTSATAAWVGLGSMKLGMFVMGALPVVGGLLILDSLCSSDCGGSLIDYYEEFWKNYEAQCELDELKKTVKRDPGHIVTAKTQAASLDQLNRQFQSLEVEHDLYLLKKQMGLLEMHFNCPACNVKLKVLSKRAGESATCSNCKTMVQIPPSPYESPLPTPDTPSD